MGALKPSYVTPDAITLPAELRSEMKSGELVLPNLINAELFAIPRNGNDYYFPTAECEIFLAEGCPSTLNSISVASTARAATA